MITQYRLIHYPDETLVTFQGDQSDLEQVSKILRFSPQPSKRTGNIEGGYYAYLRNTWRERSEREALDYLSSHFTHPRLELLLFKGNQPLKDSMPPQDWEQSIAWSIRNHFREKGYDVDHGGLSHVICRKQSHQILPDLKVLEGVSYRVQVGQDFNALIQVEIENQFQHCGKTVSYKMLVSNLKDETSECLAKIKNLVTRDTEQIFDMAINFIKSIPVPLIEDGFRFESVPLSVDNSTYKTWYWPHDQPVQIEIGQQQIVPLATIIDKMNVGIYAQPKVQIVLFIIHPSNAEEPLFSYQDWHQLQKVAADTLKCLLPTVDIPIILVEYPLSSNMLDAIRTCRNQLEQFVTHTPLFLMIGPSNEASAGSELAQINRWTGDLAFELRKVQRGAYTVSLDWNNLSNDHERNWIIESALLKGLTVLGAVPWRISNIAHSGSGEIDDLCFIGVDVNPYKKTPVVGGVIVDRYGILRGHHLVRLPKPNGDQVDHQSFRTLIMSLLKHYHKATGHSPMHLIVHRDGIAGDEVIDIALHLDKLNIGYDATEIRKSGAPRIRQSGNVGGTPSKDMAIGNCSEGIAYLVNTHSFRERLDKNRHIFPSPDPIALHHRFGKTPLQTLSAQVYALSLANYNAYRHTVRVPVTIAYADSLVNNANLKPEQNDFGKAVDGNTNLYWL